MKRFSLLLLFCLSGFGPILAAPILKLRSFSVNNGLSQYDISDIVQDSYGFMWIATYDGLNRYDGISNRIYRHSPDEVSSISYNRIRTLNFDPVLNQLWIGTDGGGINVYDYGTDSFRHLYLVEDHNPRLPENDIVDIESERGGRLWIATRNAIFLTSPAQTGTALQIIQTIPCPSGQSVRALHQQDDSTLFVAFPGRICIHTRQSGSYIFEDSLSLPEQTTFNTFCTTSNGSYIASNHGIYLITLPHENGSNRIALRPVAVTGDLSGTEELTTLAADRNVLYTTVRNKGLYRLTHSDRRLKATKVETDSEPFLSKNLLRKLYIDQSRTLWISSSNKGLGIIDLAQKQFNRLHFGQYEEDASQLVTRLMLDDRDRLWIGTQKNRLYVRLPDERFERYLLPQRPVSAIVQNSAGGIWIATGGKILSTPDTSLPPRFKEIYPGTYAFADSLGAAFSICEDSLGHVWIGCRKGIVNIRGNEHTILPLEWQNQVRVIPDRSCNRIWVCTNRNGLRQLELDSSGRIRDRHLYQYLPDNPQSLSSSVVWTLSQAADGTAYVGTDAGLNRIDPKSRRVTRFPVPSRLHSCKTLAITEDHDGTFWINTSQGVMSYDPQTGKEMIYDSTDGLSSNSMTEAAALDKDNTLYIGGNEGINYFTASDLTGNTIAPNVVISGFRIFNKPIRTGEKINGRIILQAPVLDTRSIELKHFQNNFSFDLSVLSFNNPLKNKYRYRLKGYNDEWTTADASQRSVSFNNLPPGSYRFELSAMNNDGVPTEQPKTVEILIRRAPWDTGWAYLLYTLFLGAIVLLLYHYWQKQQQLRQALFIEQIRHQAEHDANENKIRFYANITHELRTPLTLITAPLQELSARADLDPKIRSLLGIMRRNGDRLLELVNQFLDLRKIDNQNLPLQVCMCDYVKLLGATVQRFSTIAEQKNMDFRFESTQTAMTGWADADKITCIVSNLLSNAFKFTPQGGHILLSLESRGSHFIIRVEDSGCGIAPKDLPHIFERFYQADSKAASGTGIGLELVKRLVELHKGSIQAKSTLGSGSCFRIEIPVEDAAYREEERRSGSENPAAPTADPTPTPVEESADKPLLLLVEDDEEMRSYIRSLLNPDYRISEARNGKEAMEIALQEIPDLIVSDVMMPESDGIEFCHNLKNNFRTSHIPVILLTAKNAETQGLESGALDYILKPFIPQNLLLKIRNLIQYRNDCRMNPSAENTVAEKISQFQEAKEKEFLEKAYRIVEDNMSNSEFGVEEMIRILRVSRTQLHRKMTALTGKSASAFIRNVRLDKAREMLETGHYSISEVLYTVGYNSPSYFSKTYKERFGVLPSELLQK